MQLRPYQTAAIEAVEAAWERGINRPAIIAATGAGKTVTLSALIARHLPLLRARGQRALVIAHRDELLDQAQSKILDATPDAWTAVVQGARGKKDAEFAHVLIASVQTLARRKPLANVGLVIVDEAHHCQKSNSYGKVLDGLGCFESGGTRTLGVTATMTRLDGGLPEVWQEVVHEKPITELIQEGFLVPPRALALDVEGLEAASGNATNQSAVDKKSSEAMFRTFAFERIAEVYVKHAADRPGIAFLPSVAAAEALAGALTATGIRTECIDGTMSRTDRLAVYNRYRSGETQVLSSVGVLTEGFDAPHTSAVLMARPTQSPGLFVQCIGRGLRLSPETGKTDCMILDVAGTTAVHSLTAPNDLNLTCPRVDICGCGCVKCGCTGRCKCKESTCGCSCTELHVSGKPKNTNCPCSDSEECPCGCVAREQKVTGKNGLSEETRLVCDCTPGCDCRGSGEEKELDDSEIVLTEVDLLGIEIESSGYRWIATPGGIQTMAVGQEAALFLLHAPGGGFYVGLVNGFSNPQVTRLDSGAMSAEDAMKMAEDHADASGWTYSNKRASWRRTPASEPQKALLRRYGVMVPDGATKGFASDALHHVKVGRVLDPRFSQYSTPSE